MIVHRDLKPSNILVTAEGRVKLLDFGISKQLDYVERPSDPTVIGMRLLTPAYAAPEQVRGGPTGVQTDVYALGVILYELLAGRLPFELSNLTPGEAERRILEQEPARPSAVAPEALRAMMRRREWADLDSLCLTAMHKDPVRRYRSVEALHRDLVHFERAEPLEARPDNLRYRASKFVARNRGRLAASVAVAALIGSMGAFYTWRLAVARNTALAEAQRAERIQTFMLNLFDGGEVEGGPASAMRVEAIVDRGMAQARALDREPLVQAELYHTVGALYQRLGKLDLADTALQAALERRRAVLGPTSAQTIKSTIALGLLRASQSRFDEAEQLVREAVRSAEATSGPSRGAIVSATAALGQVLEERGRYTEAIPVLEQAVALASVDGADRLELATALFELANAHFYLGHYDESEALNTRVAALHEALLGPRHPSVADDLINLGAIQHERGRYDDAERFYRRALDINEGWYGPESPLTASNLTMLGRTLLLQGRLDEADATLRRALTIQEQVFGPVHRKVASATNELIGVSLKRGRVADAERYAKRTLDTYRALYGDAHFTVGVGVANLASVLLEKKEYEAAERGFREAITRYSEAQSPDHLNTGIARIKLGRSLLRQGRYADAEAESLAGYRIVSKQAEPTVSWLASARDDLVAIFEAQRQHDKAAEMRAEIARLAGRATTTP